MKAQLMLTCLEQKDGNSLASLFTRDRLKARGIFWVYESQHSAKSERSMPPSNTSTAAPSYYWVSVHSKVLSVEGRVQQMSEYLCKWQAQSRLPTAAVNRSKRMGFVKLMLSASKEPTRHKMWSLHSLRYTRGIQTVGAELGARSTSKLQPSQILKIVRTYYVLLTD